MAIWIEENAKVIVQGITGKQGLFHTEKMVEYGTDIVGGVTPGKGGTKAVKGKVDVFNSVLDAKEATDANASIIFVPPAYAGPDADAGDRGHV